MTSVSFYIKLGKNISGPVSKEKITELYKAGKINQLASVSSDKENWENINSFLGAYDQDGEGVEIEDEEDDIKEEAEKPQKKKKRSSQDFSLQQKPKMNLATAIFLVLNTVCWGLLALGTLIGGLLFVLALMKKDITAIQEAAIGAVFSTVFIGGYIFVRALDKIFALIERVNHR